MNEGKATRYRRLRRRASVVTVAAWTAFLCTVLATDASQDLAAFATGLTDQLAVPEAALGPIGAVVYTLTLSLVGASLAFPFTWYREFILERRFGRSRQPLSAWVVAQGQTTLVHIVLLVMGAAVLYAAMGYWPARWWIAVGVTFGAVMLATTHLAPIITLPWIYRLRPIARPALRRRLEAFTRKLGVPVTAFHEWQLGADCPHANAALVGVGPTLQVLLSDALLADYTDDEIEVVVAHELAHHVHGDLWRTLLFEVIAATLACGAAHWALLRLGERVGVTNMTDPAGLPLMVLAGGVMMAALTPIGNVLSRRYEQRADAYALAATNKPEALESGLRRLAQQALAEERPSRLVEWMFYTHPPLGTRLGAARAAMVGSSDTPGR